MEGFPGGSTVKNLPANAGGTGLIPDLAKVRMFQASKPTHHNYSLCSRAQEPQLPKPECPQASSLQQEKPAPVGSSCTATRE